VLQVSNQVLFHQITSVQVSIQVSTFQSVPVFCVQVQVEVEPLTTPVGAGVIFGGVTFGKTGDIFTQGIQTWSAWYQVLGVNTVLGVGTQLN